MDCTSTRLFTTFLAEAQEFMVTCCSLALPFPTHLQELSHYCRPTDLGNSHNYSSAPRYATLHGQHGCCPYVMMRDIVPHRAAPPKLLTFSQAFMAKITLCLLSADSFYVLAQFFTSITVSSQFETDRVWRRVRIRVLVPSTFLKRKELVPAAVISKM